MNFHFRYISRFIAKLRSPPPKPSLTGLVVIILIFTGSIFLGANTASTITDPQWRFARFLPIRISHLRDYQGTEIPVRNLDLKARHKLFYSYYVHNGKSTLLFLFLGLLLFFIPYIHVGILGFYIGIGCWIFGLEQALFKGLLPHGLIELPVIIYSSVIAQDGGWRIMFKLNAPRQCWGQFMIEIKNCAHAFLWVAPLIIVAAALEAYIH
ncbi:stage II sporulation protein M [Prosthecobacter sp.]|jgi:uncharacterized membrane protein SpoIIM required for sporulation|uniref:stage II sporulation protein M n=1 Tax=Prosthecobacter sp. TaxID=1965333 RepID=UPI003784190F